MVAVLGIVSFWAFAVLIPFAVSVKIFRSRSEDNPNSLITLAAVLTAKPVLFALIGFIPYALYVMPVLGLVASVVVALYFSRLLFGSSARIAAWVLVILDWLRLLFSMWLTYTFNLYVDAHYYFLLVTFIIPSIFALIAYIITHREINDKRKHKYYTS